MENLHLVDGGDITRVNMFAELCAGTGYTDVVHSRKEECIFCFLAFLQQECAGRDVGGLACMYACPHVRFAVLSAGCAVIHCVTMNTYCEKEKKPPRVLSEGLVTAPFVEDNTQALTHATHTHTR